MCIPGRRAQPPAEQRGAEGMEGGWLLLGMLWLLPVQGTERRGEPRLDVTPMSLRGASPRLFWHGALLSPSFPCSKMLPHALLSTLPTIPCGVLPVDWKVGTQGLGWEN